MVLILFGPKGASNPELILIHLQHQVRIQQRYGHHARKQQQRVCPACPPVQRTGPALDFALQGSSAGTSSPACCSCQPCTGQHGGAHRCTPVPVVQNDLHISRHDSMTRPLLQAGRWAVPGQPLSTNTTVECMPACLLDSACWASVERHSRGAAFVAPLL